MKRNLKLTAIITAGLILISIPFMVFHPFRFSSYYAKSSEVQLKFGQPVELQTVLDKLNGGAEFERIGEKVRAHVHADEDKRFDPFNPQIAEPGDILEFMKDYDIDLLLIKAVEILDNLSNPLPDYADNTHSFERMRLDAIEAFHLYIPLMEMLGMQGMVYRMKNEAAKFFNHPYGGYYEAFKQEWDDKQHQKVAFKNEVVSPFVDELEMFLHGKNYEILSFDEYQSYVDDALQNSTEIVDPNERYAAIKGEVAQRIAFKEQEVGRKLATIYGPREKAPASAFLKVINYMKKQYGTEWKEQLEVNGEQYGSTVEYILHVAENLHDLEALSIWGSDGIYNDVDEFYMRLDKFEPNTHKDIRTKEFGTPVNNPDLRNVNLQREMVKATESVKNPHSLPTYEAMHYAYRSDAMPFALESNTKRYAAALEASLGPANHFSYKFKGLSEQAQKEAFTLFLKLNTSAAMTRNSQRQQNMV